MKILDDSVLKTIELVLANNDIELVDVKYEFKKKQRIIRFLIDKPDGIQLKDCENVNKLIEPILDVKGSALGNYFLEIASPGLDRPLKTESDFCRVRGKFVKIQVNNRKPIVGQIETVKDEVVTLKDNDEEIVSIPISQIIKAQLEVEF